MLKRSMMLPIFAGMLALSLSGTAFADEAEAPILDPVTEEGASTIPDAPDPVIPDAIAPEEEGDEGVVAPNAPEEEGLAPELDSEEEGQEPAEEPMPGEDGEEPVPVPADDPIQAPLVTAPVPAAPAQVPQAQQAPAVVADGWSVQDGKTYYYRGGKRATGWLVTDSAPNGERGLQRYWLSSDGSLATGLIDAGSGWWAYGIAGKGYVVRGAYRDPITGWFYFADGDGRLLTPGWHVTDAFGGGVQRYWIDEKAHAAIPGTSSDGWLHFTRGDTGYVVRGYVPTGDGTAFVADNDGRLSRSCWLVADVDGQGMQRYWVSRLGKTTVGLIDAGDGWFSYGVPGKGYVVRGSFRDPITGWFYFADNNGRLLTPGWHVTDAFGGGVQRYWIDGKTHAAIPGVSAAGWRHFTRGDTGYVARGKVDCGDGSAFLADNDGRLLPAGWVVTDAFGQGMQRYYVTDSGKGAVGHFRVGGRAYYAIPVLGYVVRGKLLIGAPGSQQFVLADNDGVMEDFEGWLVTDKYDGRIERYRLDDGVVKGFYGARVGLFTLGGQDHYGRDDQGYVVRDLYRAPAGNWYLGNGDGVLQPLPAEWMDLYMMAQDFHSPTDWLILVDTNDPRVGIYHYNYDRGGWDVAQEWLCTVGAYGTPTVTGTFYIQSSGYSFGHGYTCYYWTQFYGDYLFHSIKYYPGTFDVMDGRLGVHASLGCVRLDINNAAWLQYNIPRDTKVYVF